MKTNYLLPAVVALMAHSALLFGVVTAPAIVPPVEAEAATTDRFLIPLPVVEELSVDHPDDEERERTPTDASFSPSSEPKRTIPVVMHGGLPFVSVERSGYGLVPVIPGDAGMIGIGEGASIFRTTDLDHVPRIRLSSAPEYPLEARKSGLTGEVIVEFLVNEHGEVESPRVVRSSDSKFVESALKAAVRWRFEPGRKDGRPVRFRMAIPFVFTLDR